MTNSIVLLGLAIFLLVVLLRTIKIVPQKQVKIIERLGRYHRSAEAGLNTIVPFLDSVRATIDLREQITKIEPQPVITRDNVTMEVDAVIYYLIADPAARPTKCRTSRGVSNSSRCRRCETSSASSISTTRSVRAIRRTRNFAPRSTPPRSSGA